MTTLSHFARAVRITDLNAHLEKIGAPSFAQQGHPEHERTTRFVQFVRELEPRPREQLMVDIERVTGMTDELGQTALLELSDWKERLRQIDGAYARAHWLFVCSEGAFRMAEEIRYAEEHRNAARLWDAFIGPVGATPDRGALNTLRDAIAQELGAGPLQVDCFERPGQRSAEGRILQITIYSEGLPQDDLAWNNGRVVNQPRKPVRETAVVYDALNGVIEVVGRSKEARKSIARLFASCMLGVEIAAARLPPRIYTLDQLLEAGMLPTDPADGIELAKVTQLTLIDAQGVLQQTFSVPFDSDRTLHTVVASKYGSRNPLTFERPIRAQSMCVLRRRQAADGARRSE